MWLTNYNNRGLEGFIPTLAPTSLTRDNTIYPHIREMTMGFSLLNAATPVAVTNSVTTLYSAPTAGGQYIRDLVISNAGTATIYLGGSAMTQATSQYLALPVNESILLGGQVESVYAITAAGTATAYVGNASTVLVA